MYSIDKDEKYYIGYDVTDTFSVCKCQKFFGVV